MDNTTETVKVWRLEHNWTREGPYFTCLNANLSIKAYNLMSVLLRAHQISKNHPTATVDVAKFCRVNDVSCCDSFEQLVTWFGKTRLLNYVRLPNDEFSVVVYTVPSTHVKYGKKQCAFNKKDALSRQQVPAKDVKKMLKEYSKARFLTRWTFVKYFT